MVGCSPEECLPYCAPPPGTQHWARHPPPEQDRAKREWLRPSAEGACAYQAEGPQHRQVAHAGQAQLHEAEDDNDAVEDVPALLEVVVGVKGDDLEGHLRCEDPCEDLEREQGSAGPPALARDPGRQEPCFLTFVLAASPHPRASGLLARLISSETVRIHHGFCRRECNGHPQGKPW